MPTEGFATTLQNITLFQAREIVAHALTLFWVLEGMRYDDGNLQGPASAAVEGLLDSFRISVKAALEVGS